MDLDSFLAMPKWEILEILAERPSSPSEIAEITKTTISYVSQQLKLLEAVGMIKKTKTGAFLKGKPRNIFSLTENFVFFSVLSTGFAAKKKLSLDARRLMFFRIWSLDNNVFHLPLEKFLLHIDGFLPDLEAIYLDSSQLNKIDLKILSDKRGLLNDLKLSVKRTNEDISFSVYSKKNFDSKSFDSLYVLYDPQNILKTKEEELKGGNE